MPYTFSDWAQIGQDMLGVTMLIRQEKESFIACGTCVFRRAHRPTFPQCVKCEDHSNWVQSETKEEINMENTKVVMVQFERDFGWSGEYAFKTDLDLKVGDDVLVDVTKKGATMARVSKIDTASTKATRWVIQKVDYDAHKARIVREAKLQALKERMQARRVVLEENEIFVKWAQKDSEMASLVAEYNATVSGASAGLLIFLADK